MFNWIGGGKPDHPLADPKDARKVLAEIPANDAFKAVEELSYWLDSVQRTEGFKLDRSFALYDQIDQAARVHQRKLSQDYLAPRLQKFHENRLWTTMFDFWRLLGAGYLACLEGFQSGAAGAGGIKADLPVIVCRAMRALGLQIKWTLMRYGAVDDRIWADLGRLYLFAESKGFAEKDTAMYTGAHGVSTVRQEFLKPLMLVASSTDSLVPARLDLAERTVAHLGARFVLAQQRTAECTGWFDLAMRKPPSRLVKDIEAAPTTRFFGAGPALDDLRAMMDYTAKEGVLPSDVNLGPEPDKDAVLEVWKHLASYWSSEPPARSSERRKATARLTVVNGFDEIIRVIDPELANSLDFMGGETESWIVDNVSEGGYGAIIPQVKGDWVKVGALVGVKAEGEQHWTTGIIRRISRDDSQRRRVGIQLCGRVAIAVKLAAAAEASSFNPTRENENAILLSTKPDTNGEVRLLLAMGGFVIGQPLEMRVTGKSYLVTPTKRLEDGDGFDLGRYRISRRS